MVRRQWLVISACSVALPWAAAGALAWPASVPLGFDAYRFFLPLVQVAADHLRAGELPVWTDRLGLGFPLLASGQAALLYPPLWPLLALPRAADGLGLYLLAHLMWAALGGVRMARRAGLSPLAGLCAAAVCGASLPVVSLTNRPEFTAALAWAPHLLAAALHRRPRFPGVELGLCAGLCALVSPQMAAGHLGAAILAAALWQPPRAWPPARVVGQAVLAFLTVASPFLLPFLEMLPWSDRAGQVAFNAMEHSLDPIQLPQFLLPAALGHLPAVLRPLLTPGEPAQAAGHLQWLAAPAAGTLATTLAVLALAGSRRARRLMPLMALMALLVMPLLIPGVAALWHLPPLSVLRFPAKVWHTAIPLLGLLAAVGVDLARRRPARAAVLVVSASAAAALILLVADPLAAVLVARSRFTGIEGAVARGLGGAAALGLLASALGGAALLWRRARLLSVVLAAEVVLLGGGGQVVGALLPGDEPTLAGQVADAVGQRPRLVLAPVDPHERAELLDREPTREGRARVEQRRSEFATALWQGASLVMSPTGIRLMGWRRLEQALRDRPADQCLLAGCQAVVGPLASRVMPVTLGAGFTHLDQVRVDGLTAWRPETPVGHAQVAAVIHRVADPAHLPQVMAEPAVNWRTDAVLVGRPDLTGTLGEVSRHEARTRHHLLQVSLAAPGLVFTRDAHGPGWQALVDGIPADIVPVHGALRGVEVGAGNHTVEFIHRADSLWAGLALSLVCALWLRRRVTAR